MNKAVFNLDLPQNIKEEAERLAAMEGVSLDEWLAFAITQKVGSAENVATFLRNKAAGARGRGLEFYLNRVPDVPPLEGDERPLK